MRSQVHVKLVKASQFGGGCNNISAGFDAINFLDTVNAVRNTIIADTTQFANLSSM